MPPATRSWMLTGALVTVGEAPLTVARRWMAARERGGNTWARIEGTTDALAATAAAAAWAAAVSSGRKAESSSSTSRRTRGLEGSCWILFGKTSSMLTAGTPFSGHMCTLPYVTFFRGIL
uniref:Putative secreted protein n=1 Tax=Ixodes ricinus TaxID=34613 RepID=A0A147BMS9_IXORI